MGQKQNESESKTKYSQTYVTVYNIYMKVSIRYTIVL